MRVWSGGCGCVHACRLQRFSRVVQPGLRSRLSGVGVVEGHLKEVKLGLARNYQVIQGLGKGR